MIYDQKNTKPITHQFVWTVTIQTYPGLTEENYKNLSTANFRTYIWNGHFLSRKHKLDWMRMLHTVRVYYFFFFFFFFFSFFLLLLASIRPAGLLWSHIFLPTFHWKSDGYSTTSFTHSILLCRYHTIWKCCIQKILNMKLHHKDVSCA
jgi:hypothetical protein